jgi:hypothetical protein
LLAHLGASISSVFRTPFLAVFDSTLVAPVGSPFLSSSLGPTLLTVLSAPFISTFSPPLCASFAAAQFAAITPFCANAWLRIADFSARLNLGVCRLVRLWCAAIAISTICEGSRRQRCRAKRNRCD